jgi:hypothetical protein
MKYGSLELAGLPSTGRRIGSTAGTFVSVMAKLLLGDRRRHARDFGNPKGGSRLLKNKKIRGAHVPKACSKQEDQKTFFKPAMESRIGNIAIYRSASVQLTNS